MTLALTILALLIALVAICLSVVALKLSIEARLRAEWVEQRTWNGGIGRLPKKENGDG